jgi:hypothetical protein
MDLTATDTTHRQRELSPVNGFAEVTHGTGAKSAKDMLFHDG